MMEKLSENKVLTEICKRYTEVVSIIVWHLALIGTVPIIKYTSDAIANIGKITLPANQIQVLDILLVSV